MGFLEVDSVIKTYNGEKILNGIYLKIKDKECVTILGKNGAGKSTLLEIIFGSKKSDFGLIRLNGGLLNTIYSRKNKILYLPPNHLIFDKISLKTLSIIFGVDLTFYTDIIGRKKDLSISDLSFGEKKLLEIFLILKGNSAVSILDEPFKDLSPIFVEIVLDLILEVKKDKSVLLTDHNYRNCFKISDKVYFLENGTLKNVMDVKELIHFGYISSYQ